MKKILNLVRSVLHRFVEYRRVRKARKILLNSRICPDHFMRLDRYDGCAGCQRDQNIINAKKCDEAEKLLRKLKSANTVE